MKSTLKILVSIVIFLAVGIWLGGTRSQPAKVASALTQPARNSLITLDYLSEKVDRTDRRIDSLIDRVIALEGGSANPEVSTEYLEDEIYSIWSALEDVEETLSLLEEDTDYAVGWIDEIYAVICYGDVAVLNAEPMCD